MNDHPAINGYHYTEVRDRIGYPVVTAKDFKKAGPLRATDYGVAQTQTDKFACMLHAVMDEAETDPPEEQEGFYLVLATFWACQDRNGHLTANDADFTRFVNRNLMPLSRLLMPAMTMRYPKLLSEVFADKAQDAC